jgi:hypothetical protein
MSAKVVSCSNINGYLRNYQDCLTLIRQIYLPLAIALVSKYIAVSNFNVFSVLVSNDCSDQGKLDWSSTGSCYKLFDQGPCANNQELVLSKSGFTECKTKICRAYKVQFQKKCTTIGKSAPAVGCSAPFHSVSFSLFLSTNIFPLNHMCELAIENSLSRTHF